MLWILFFVFAVSLCQANVPVTPKAIWCADNIPDNLFHCIGTPKITTPEVSVQCTNTYDCEKYTCIFRKSNWMDGDKINKQRLSAHFDQFAKDNPSWGTAVQNAKTNCLAVDLPAQGVYLNCPAYDVLMCTLAAFVRNAQPSQWSQSPQCSYARQYAAACPLCPNQCFARQIPIGSCNACLSLPRSP